MNVDNRKAAGSNGSGQAAAKSSKALLKCPSPPRPGQETQELTFRQKLEEVKRLRSSGLPTNAGAPRQTTSKSGPAPLPAPVPAKPKVLINGKEALAMHGDWALMESSSGRKYFFNVKTMVNQWTRPKEWPAKRKKVPPNAAPPPPPPPEPPSEGVQSEEPPPPPPPEPEQRFQMKMAKSKQLMAPATQTAMATEDEDKRKLPKLEPGESLADAAAAAAADSEETEGGHRKRHRRRHRRRRSSSHRSRRSDSRSRSRSRSSSRSRSRSYSSRGSSRSSSYSSYGSRSRSRSPENGRGRHTNSLVLEARARIESQIGMMGQGQASSSDSMAGPQDLLQLTSGSAPPSTLLDTAGNPTWVTEHNFPAMLARCKFPKKYDALHELQTNKSKKRLFAQMPPPPLPEGMAAVTGPEMQEEIRKSMFTTELKNPNNRNRLLGEKLGLTVYKIPDELWERSYQQFQVDLKPGVKLEARPHAYTDDDKPVYTRTGKVAKVMPYPEDVVRCHAVIQAWKTDVCHCVYANKTYTIEKDDKQWGKDLEECRKFLDDEG